MRVKLSVARFLSYTCLPTLCLVIAAYFGYHALWGAGGYHARQKVEIRLAREQSRLHTISDQRRELQHRIDLLQKNDPDLIEELARTELMDSAPGQVAIPRAPLGK